MCDCSVTVHRVYLHHQRDSTASNSTTGRYHSNEDRRTQPEADREGRGLETNEERLDYLKECGVELDEDTLANVAGGKDTKTSQRQGM